MFIAKYINMYIGVHVELIAEYFHNKNEHVSTSTILYYSHTFFLSLSCTLSDTSMLY